MIQLTGLSNAASLPATEIYAHAAAVFQTTEFPTAAVLQAVRIHVPAVVTLPAESSGADSIHAAGVHAPAAVIQSVERHTYTIDETAVLSFTAASNSTGAILEPTHEACGTCDMSTEMATAIVERTQRIAAQRLKSSL